MAKSDLYKTSGHWDKFADDIFHVSSKVGRSVCIETDEPRTTPQIYASSPRRGATYRFVCQVTTVYRMKIPDNLPVCPAFVLSRKTTHIFCTLEQVKEEANGIFEIISKFYAVFECLCVCACQ